LIRHVAHDEQQVSLTAAQEAELDRRLEDLARNPDSGEFWEDVRARLYDRLREGG
jgi:putative addiction module component (TIGR02574 family)